MVQWLRGVQSYLYISSINFRNYIYKFSNLLNRNSKSIIDLYVTKKNYYFDLIELSFSTVSKVYKDLTHSTKYITT